MYTLIGAPGWGSAIPEALFELSGLPYRVEDIDPKKPTTESKRLTSLTRSPRCRPCCCRTAR
jgi:glutathione S-transferase